MTLILQSQTLEHVVVIRCAGRIVLGDEIKALQAEVERLTRTKKRVVLQLAEVNYIDSAALGALVRLFGVLRSGGGGLKLSQLSPFVHKVLQATNLKEAVDAFSERLGPQEKTSTAPRTKIVCLDTSNDLLAYLKALLTRAGYEVFTTKQTADARTMIVATKPSLVIYGPGTQTSEAAVGKFRESYPGVQVLVLPGDFSTADASQAGTELLERVRAMFGGAA
jgi:anti-anti-sigma factor